jgi:hypoxanthine phosphoribosyltransferase
MSEPMVRSIQWDGHQILVDRLLAQIEQSGLKFGEVVALGRGGFIAGVHLSHRLGIPLTPLMWQTRDGTIAQHHIATLGRALIVDDINDSGKTLIEVTSMCSWLDGYSVAVQINKTSSAFTAVDFYAEVGDDDVWYEFPWER